jgi:D-alanine-D-alanine ligase-like ATP-grasp enzyme
MKTRVAVVYGGRSGEHEISLLSAEVGDRRDESGAL